MPHWLLNALFYFPIESIFVIGSVFSVAVWPLQQRRSRASVLAAWLACSLLFGFLWYRGSCAMPATCDVGRIIHWHTVLPRTTLVWASAFGAATLATNWMLARRPTLRLWGGGLVGGAVSTFGFALAHSLFYVLGGFR